MPTIAPLDREVLRLWRLTEQLESGIKRVRVLPARRAARGMQREAHQHHVPTLVACLAGVVRIEAASGPIDLAPGEVLAIAPGAWHVHAPLRRECCAYLQGAWPLVSDVWLMREGRCWRTLLPVQPSLRLMGDLVAGGEAAQLKRTAADLIGQCLSGASATWQVTAAQKAMANYLWRNMHRPVTAAEVLVASGLGERQAHRQFCAYYGATPKQVLLRFRLDLAGQLLVEGAGVAEAAAACGFSDRADLTRAWRRAHGQPPTATRQLRSGDRGTARRSLPGSRGSSPGR
jgi:AraC family transcriptional regulator